MITYLHLPKGHTKNRGRRTEKVKVCVCGGGVGYAGDRGGWGGKREGQDITNET